MTTSKFQFVNPFLKELNYQEHNFDANAISFDLENQFEVKIDKNLEERRALVQLKLEMNTANKNAPYELSIAMASVFEWEDEIGSEDVDSYLEINAPALLLSYMRPIVSSITASSRFPAVNLPFFNFTQK